MTKQTINGYLPIFKGFYGSNAEDYFNEFDSFCDDDNNETHIKYDYEKYCDAIAKKYVSLINEAILKKSHNGVSVLSFEFEKIESPREYNFENDEIQTQTTFDYEAIMDYLKFHTNQFDEYCKANFTSRDGFCSFYPNNAIDFLKLLDTDKREAILNHVIDFIVCNLINADTIEEKIQDFCYEVEMEG